MEDKLMYFGIAVVIIVLVKAGQAVDAFVESIESKNRLRKSKAKINEAIAEKIIKLDSCDKDFCNKLESIVNLKKD